ncbi:GNAT family N-acetyltransferase [Streptomyces sp. NPDC004684]
MTPRSALLSAAPAAHRPPQRMAVRPAGPGDASALYRLSRAFVRTGELRARSVADYARDAGDFLIAESAVRGVEGCGGLRCEPDAPRTAVVYNFCVAKAGQGRGVGTALLRALLAEAAARSVGAVFTATSGSAALFLRHGFTVLDAATADWLVGLDPRRGSRVLSLPL